MHKLRTAAIALTTACLVAPAAPGRGQDQQQGQPQGRFGEKVTVREVVLDALVTDPQEHVVLGLGKKDFVVREDGKPVELTGVSFYSNRRLLETPGETARKAAGQEENAAAQTPESRYFILFFDDQKSNNFDAPFLLQQQIEAGRRAREWAAKSLLPNDHVAVVSYDFKLKIHQDWSLDRSGLAQAITDAYRGKETEGNWPSRLKDPQKDAGPSLLAHLPRGNELRDKTTNIYHALERLAEASAAVTGRKNLLLFTTGFGQLDPFGHYHEDPRYYPRMMQELNDSNVAAYLIDLVPADYTHVMSDAMNQLALDTGGKYFFSVVNYSIPLAQIAKENNGYYLLSYRSEHPAGASGFQEVEVKAANPTFHVRARKGYLYGAPGRGAGGAASD